MSRYDFLVESYRTERLKTLSVWSQIPDARMTFRPELRARTPLEHMVHQCVSEDTWMGAMLGVAVSLPGERLARIESQPDAWFEAETTFFDVNRSKAWVLTRRLTHSAHHRGQLTVYLRLWGQALYSTYGPTADTGGLFQNKAPVIYRYASVADLLECEASGGENPPLPGPGATSPTERPDRSL